MAEIIKAVFLTVLIHLAVCSNTKTCVQKNPCLCEFSKSKKIDISSVAPKAPEDFLSDDKSKISYHFHGCTDGEFKYKNATNYTISLKTSVNIVELSGTNDLFCFILVGSSRSQ